MLISVIIPIYNKDKYLDECISSVVNQTYKKLEIILVNDGSTDESERIINKWYKSDDRIIYFNQKNTGVSSARNQGISKANGDYVFFLDADDKLKENALNLFYQESLNNKSDIIMGNFIHVKNERMYYRPEISKFVELDNLSLLDTKIELFVLNSRLLSMVCNKLYKLKFLKKYRLLFDNKVTSEDRLFNLKCYVNCPSISYIYAYTYYYNEIENSRSNIIPKDFYDECISLIHVFNAFIQDKNNSSCSEDLLNLMVLLDVNKSLKKVVELSGNNYKEIKSVSVKLKKDELIYSCLEQVFSNNEILSYKKSKKFNGMKRSCYILYKYPQLIAFYKFVGEFKSKLKRSLFN